MSRRSLSKPSGAKVFTRLWALRECTHRPWDAHRARTRGACQATSCNKSVDARACRHPVALYSCQAAQRGPCSCLSRSEMWTISLLCRALRVLLLKCWTRSACLLTCSMESIKIKALRRLVRATRGLRHGVPSWHRETLLNLP